MPFLVVRGLEGIAILVGGGMLFALVPQDLDPEQPGGFVSFKLNSTVYKED